MHPIASQYRGANGLGAGDVDLDGDIDYLTNYEFDQRYILSLNPGTGSAQSQPWPQLQVWPPNGGAPGQGGGVNPENSQLIDVDGDGNLDIVGAQGESLLEFWEGNSPGVRVIFNPGPTQVTNPDAWIDAGRVPSTVTFGHFHQIVSADINNDGLTDIVAGGRRSSTTGDYAGIQWLEAPTDPNQRRDLSAYQLHAIDPSAFSGHGITFSDVDQDGDADIVSPNADFDTPESDRSISWYENPGATSVQLRSPWTRRLIFSSPTFHTKPQVGVGDLDADGLTDYVTMTEHEVLWFRKTSLAPVSFTTLRIPKDPAADFLTRPVRVTDVNGDGRLDLVGMMTHSASNLPDDRAAVFWMEFVGPTPTAANWVTHVIRWGSGHTAWLSEFGEKWDQVDIRDVDSDGDLDIVANCEEWWQQRPIEVNPYYAPNVDPETVAVVWFENTVNEATPTSLQVGDHIVMEAERMSRANDGRWVERGRYPGSIGTYLQNFNAVSTIFDTDLPQGDRETAMIGAATTPGVAYDFTADGGSYTMWVRRWLPGEWGYGMGGPRSDSAWGSVDGGASFVIDDQGGPSDTWVWQRVSTPLTFTHGAHSLALRERERGYAVDRIVLSADPGFVPSGPGPAATPG